MLPCRRVLSFAPAALFLGTRRGPAHCEREEKPASSKRVDAEIYSPAPAWRREWNHDWDGRHPAQGKSRYQGKVRHILLIRHGQYDLDDPEHGLTQLGFEQARVTGKRLATEAEGVKKDVYGETQIQYHCVVTSTLLRARQTAAAIASALPDVPLGTDDPLLAEGWPVLPMPQGPDFIKDGKVFPSTLMEDGPRIEAAFRKYVHRDVDHKRAGHREKAAQLSDGYAPADAQNAISPEAAAAAQRDHEYLVIVCHMNVIRYFVARALQLPPEAWLRMRGNNCGVTELIIQPSGQVSLGSFADVGHLSIEQVTFH